MKINGLFIGHELLNGQIANSNLQVLGDKLNQAGLSIHQSVTVPDCIKQLRRTIEKQITQSEVIIICGGLGPTADDLTRQAVALALNLQTETSTQVMEKLRQYMKLRKKDPGDDYYTKQSEVIAGAEILENPVGLAPGLCCTTSNCSIYLLPGPPREFTPMVADIVIPRLLQLHTPQTKTLFYHTYGLSESTVEEMSQSLLKKYPFITPAYCANLGHVKLTWSFPLKYLSSQTAISHDTLEIFGNDILLTEDLMEPIAKAITANSLTLGTAESCTGGGIGSAITSWPGSSSFFKGSINTYANEWKEDLLGVKNETLEKFGAVSEQCVSEMMTGLCTRFKLDCAIVCSGIAGPDGGSEEKPVGLVYIGCCSPTKSIIKEYNFSGNRNEVREQAVRYALNSLRLLLKEAEITG